MYGLLELFRGRGSKGAGKTGRRTVVRGRSTYDWSRGMELLEDRTHLSVAWYVSPTGSDTLNTGQSLVAPFQTIQKAASLAAAGDTVFIRAGTYRETVTPANSGTSIAPITYMPYNGEKVTIDGADLVTNWTLYNSGTSGPIYQAPMNWSVNGGDGDQVFVDGQMMNYARYPNTSLDVSRPTKITADTGTFTAGTPTNTGVYTSTALNAYPANYWNGATIHFVPGYEWMQQTGTVISSSPGSVTFSYVSIGLDPSAGNPFYLTGKFQALDASAEWYLDPTAQQLSLWTPTGDSPSNHIVEAKHRNYGLDLSGLSYINVQGVNLFACSMNTSSASTHNTIDGIQALYVSHFEQATTGLWGLHMEDTGIIIKGSNNILENSEIGFSAGNGVLLMGNNTSQSTGNIVTNNVIHDVDYMSLDCGGINTGNGGGNPVVYNTTSTFNTISNNTIYNSGRDLIVFRNLGSGFIINNDLYNGMLQTADGGAMYSYEQNGKAFNSSNPDTVIAYNRVHDLLSGSAVGIYLDNGSTNYIVHHNMVYNVSTALTLNLPSNNNLVYNNTLVGNSISIGTWGANTDMSGTYIENNLCTSAVNLGTNYAAYTYNLPSTTFPAFVDPNSMNFQLLSNSAAVDQGAVISPYTDGFVGAAPDIGAFEYGLTPWIAGAGTATNAYIAAIPAVPTALAATSPGPSQINLAWQNNAANVTSCVVERSTDGKKFTSIVRLPAIATSYTDTTPTSGTYYYRVRFDNGIYNSSYSISVSADSTPVPFTNTIQAENFTTASGVSANGNVITNCNVGNWAEYDNVNFPAGVDPAGLKTSVNQITIRYSSVAAGGNSIKVYADSLTGTLLGSATTQYDPAGGFFTATINIGDRVPVNSITAGLHNIYVAFAGSGNGGLNVAGIDWIQFSSIATPALQQTPSSYFTDTGGTRGGVIRSGGGLGGCDVGDWAQFTNTYFSAGVNQISVRYTSPYAGGNHIEFRLDSVTNPVIGYITTQYDSTGAAFVDSATVSGVTSGIHDLYITFSGTGNGGWGVCNMGWFQFADTTSLATPTGLVATAASATTINLSWADNSSNEAGFKIERSTDNQTFIQVGTVGPNGTATGMFTDTGLSAVTTYYYQVRAYNQDAGNTAYTNIANALTYSAAPTGLGSTAVSSTQVNLAWVAPAGTISGYNVYRGTTSGGESLTPLNGGTLITTTAYNDTTATAGTTYYYTVKAVNSSGSSAASNEANALTYPGTPTGLIGTTISTTQINLSWTALSGTVIGYNVYRGTTSGGESLAPLNGGTLITTTTYNDTTVSAGTAYYYNVVAVNSTGNSVASTEANAITTAPLANIFTTNTDIGSPGAAGSSTFSGGIYTVKGAGTDIAGTSDKFQYDYRNITGNGTIIARVVTVQNTNVSAKGGVMFRNGTAANAMFVAVEMTPSNGVILQWRTTTGGTASSTTVSGRTLPHWVKLVRTGNSFSGYYSSNGVTWTQIGTTKTVAMASAATVGLSVTSRVNTTLCTATFDNVSISSVAAKLTGTAIGTVGSRNNSGNDITKVFDSNLTTYFDAPIASGSWVGLDMGSTKLISQIKFSPRSGYESLMLGGKFQVSNTADFSSGVVDLGIIKTTPATGALTTINVVPNGAYRYIRYIGPDNGWCNIAELEVWGY